jgi:hypothetical protein
MLSVPAVPPKPECAESLRLNGEASRTADWSRTLWNARAEAKMAASRVLALDAVLGLDVVLGLETVEVLTAEALVMTIPSNTE